MKTSPTSFLLAGLCALALGCPSESNPQPSDETSTGTTGEPDPTTSGPPTTSTTTSESTGEETTDASTGTTLVEGSSSESGTDSTGAVVELPDLDMDVVLRDTAASVYTQRVSFSDTSCPMLDECVGGTGERRLLRFSTITPNLGTADFHVGSPASNPELFEFSECQGTDLFADYASYRLLDADGLEVGTGHKSAFALIDLVPWTDDAGPAQYGFGQEMGISVGWADVYDAGLECQWVDITDVPIGDYTLEISVNPLQVIEESSYDNNILLVPVTITDEDVPGPPAGWVCPAGYYDAADGCDCGCGVFDPDCANATVDACEYCDGPGACSTTCADIDPEDNSQCA
jgi:hypothetical protein